MGLGKIFVYKGFWYNVYIFKFIYWFKFFPVISHLFNKQAYTQRSYFVVFRIILKIKFPF